MLMKQRLGIPCQKVYQWCHKLHCIHYVSKWTIDCIVPRGSMLDLLAQSGATHIAKTRKSQQCIILHKCFNGSAPHCTLEKLPGFSKKAGWWDETEDTQICAVESKSQKKPEKIF